MMRNIFKSWIKTPEERDRAKAESIENELDRTIAIAKVDKKYNKISQQEFEKRIATANEEPYVRVVSLEIDEKSPGSGFFELDFNEHFVEYLANSGYEGVEPEQIVDNWFNDLCQNIVMEGLEDEDGTAKSFMTDSKEGLIIQRLKTDEDTAEYS
jgi:RNA 3'-terminal phosphate cyclase